MAELATLWVQTRVAAAAAAQPDGVFVEDTAVLVPEVGRRHAARGGVAPRGGASSVAAALARHLALARVQAPGTLEGGDVLRIGRTLYVGASAAPTRQAWRSSARRSRPSAIRCESVALRGCLHLKSAVTFIPPARCS